MYKKAITFSKTLNDIVSAMAQSDTGTLSKAHKLDSEWISCLHKPQHACDSYFQFDLDNVTASESYTFASDIPRG